MPAPPVPPEAPPTRPRWDQPVAPEIPPLAHSVLQSIDLSMHASIASSIKETASAILLSVAFNYDSSPSTAAWQRGTVA